MIKIKKIRVKDSYLLPEKRCFVNTLEQVIIDKINEIVEIVNKREESNIRPKPTPLEENKEIYYRIVCNLTPLSCRHITYCLVISEDYIDFLKRTEDQYQKVQLISVEKCNKETYNILKRSNPTNESYLKLLKRDYSKFYKE